MGELLSGPRLKGFEARGFRYRIWSVFERLERSEVDDMVGGDVGLVHGRRGHFCGLVAPSDVRLAGL